MWPCAGKTVRPRAVGAFRAGETQILTSGDAFCVALRRENNPTECFAQAKRKFWTAEMNLLWPCAGETQILTSGDASSVQIMWMSQHPFISQDPLQDPCLRSLSIFVSQDSLKDPCLRIHVSASTNMDPLQDPRLWAHISASLYLRLLCKIHVSGSVCISGSSARSMSPIHVSASLYLRVLCKIHVFEFMSQHLRISGSSARSMCPIHVLAFMSQHPFISQDPLQDPCLRSLSIFVSQDSLQDPCLRIHVSASTNMDPLRIHVFGLISQHLCISGSSARSMSPDPYISIHMYLRILCKIHVPGFMSQLPYVSQDPLQDPCSARSMCPIHVLASSASHFVPLRRRNANFDLRRRVLCGPAQGKQSGREPWERFARAKRKF